MSTGRLRKTEFASYSISEKRATQKSNHESVAGTPQVLGRDDWCAKKSAVAKKSTD